MPQLQTHSKQQPFGFGVLLKTTTWPNERAPDAKTNNCASPPPPPPEAQRAFLFDEGEWTVFYPIDLGWVAKVISRPSPTTPCLQLQILELQTPNAETGGCNPWTTDHKRSSQNINEWGEASILELFVVNGMVAPAIVCHFSIRRAKIDLYTVPPCAKAYLWEPERGWVRWAISILVLMVGWFWNLDSWLAQTRPRPGLQSSLDLHHS